MPKILSRSFWILAVMVGMWSFVVLGILALSYFWPGSRILHPLSLPEDILWVAIAQFFLKLALAFPALFLSTLVLAFSFILKPTDFPIENGRLTEGRALAQISTFLILGASFLALLVLLTEPAIKAYLDQAAYKVHQTTALEQAYLKLKASNSQTQNFQAKLIEGEEEAAILQRLLTLRPQQRFFTASSPFDYEFEYQIVRSHLELERFLDFRILPQADLAQPGDQRPVSELLETARQLNKVAAFARNAYEINHLAYQVLIHLMNAEDQGLIIDKTIEIEAKALVDSSWQDISQRSLNTNERLRASYFFRKGKSLGDYEFKNYLEAFYGFEELHHENPKDAEVSRYESLALDQLKNRVLFAEDLDVLFQVPGWDNVVFRNPSPELPSGDRGAIELVRIGRVLDTSQGTFVKNFEVLRYLPDGTPLLHWIAPYGKWVNGQVQFDVWNKNRPEAVYPKVDLETPGNRLYQTGERNPPPYPLTISVGDLAFVAQQSLPETLTTFDLMSHAKDLISLGVNPLPWQTEFVFRFVSPFAFLALSFATFYFAWLLRSSSNGKMPWIWRSLVILLPLILGGAVELASWVTKIVTSGLLQKFGFEFAFLGLIGIALALTVSFLIASWLELTRHRPQ